LGIGRIEYKKLHTSRLLAYFKSLKARVGKLATAGFTMDSIKDLKELRAYKDEVKKELDTRPHIHGDSHVTLKTRAGKKIGEECTCESHPEEGYCPYSVELSEEPRLCDCCSYCRQQCAEDI